MHMTPEEFRRHGREAIDWIADYLERLEELPVGSSVEPGWVRSQLPEHAPEHGEPFADVLADLDRVIVPGLLHWQSPGFFGYFSANSSGPSVLGELLSAGLGVQGMLWSTSPAVTELETHVLDWLVELLDLPERFRSTGKGGGVIQDSASSAVLCAVIAARQRAGGGELVGYTSTQTHSSVEKAFRIAGLGAESLRLVPVDDAFALDLDAMATLVAADRAAGLTPFFCCATVGSTSSEAVDPVRAIGELCLREGLWMHVDSAMLGVATICPEHRPQLNDGLELADSYCTNAHKWLLVNFDCTLFFIADRAALISSLSVLPEYLRNAASESGAVIDYRDWQVPLGRRFRSLKLWMVLRHYGAEGLRSVLREHIALTRQAERWIASDPRFELLAPPGLNLLCFGLRGRPDDETERLMVAVNATGEAFLTHTKLAGRYAIRLMIGSARTELRHVQHVWALLQQHAPEQLPLASLPD